MIKNDNGKVPLNGQITFLEALESKANELGITIRYCNWDTRKSAYLRLKNKNKPPMIFIAKHISDAAKIELLCEELAHHALTIGDITAENTVGKRKQEKAARLLAFRALLPASDIQKATLLGHQTAEGIAECIGCSQAYAVEALALYSQKESYGNNVVKEG